ncbi:AHS2-domain-containing protein [Coniophora puteana RWD-64-598 SS2]|uniref:AHS2-domain-containing protein n=1 Tax=Coniophora puteana (strain RWD-64-598) TaxID=741705 RepID=A0A5M3MEQ7_CONPW|nr:AHS2-domain-containing protein [Coniophora puteana RWD-64-598 SS2]EIW77496.1 AHS2-domain-containing protein [Coniophora puteana RWD-64-598 SS2]
MTDSTYTGHKLLIANRGEIAVRIIRTAKRLGIPTVAVYTSSDSLSPHVSLANESVNLHDLDTETTEEKLAEPRVYISISLILAACRKTGATMVHPGYGFLAENAEFARAVVGEGIVWLGPQPDVIEAMGLKHEARRLAERAGLSLVPGSKGLVTTVDDALSVAGSVGFPIMLKATAGGGGMGLVICGSEEELKNRFEPTKERAKALFHNDGVFIERYYPSARHIEIQVFGDGQGNIVHMGERECKLRSKICGAAVRLCESIRYSSAGTVEFLVDDLTGDFFFLEMNTRIQVSAYTRQRSRSAMLIYHYKVEHPVTECIHPGLDLIELMILLGVATSNSTEIHASVFDQSVYDANIALGTRHAIEARVYSENPADGFKPSPGVLQHVSFGEEEWLRVDHWISRGTTVTPHFDPLLCKVIVVGNDREEAIQRMSQALSTCEIYGPPNNASYLQAICADPIFSEGRATTTALTVLHGGIEATIQDLPGRHVSLGIPRSGPMDARAFRAANVLAGNHPHTAALEIVVLPGVPFKAKFHVAAAVGVAGKPVGLRVGGRDVPMWAGYCVPAGCAVEIGVSAKHGQAQGDTPGFRVYLAVRGGFPEVPEYLGSKSTSMGLGGYQGRALLTGDQLALGNDCSSTPEELQSSSPYLLPRELVLAYSQRWTVKVLPGPQDDAEFLTPEGRARFYSTTWRVSPSSNRMGVRLERFEYDQTVEHGGALDVSENAESGGKSAPLGIGWARPDGGEGGAHPSNILDNGYALGTVNVNGDTPVILTQEGPDMGGYVCLCTVASAELWKIGQLSPGSVVRFEPVSWDVARELHEEEVAWVNAVESAVRSRVGNSEWKSRRFSVPKLEETSAILLRKARNSEEEGPSVTFRQAGDSAILVEYGNMHLDFHIRARVHALEREVARLGTPGILSFSPCIRSTLIHFDHSIISQSTLLAALASVDTSLPASISSVTFPGRRITFPIALDDRWNREALERYMSTTRQRAVYLPSNVEYLAKNNGLSGGKEEVLAKLVESDWLVFGVGFYLACPFLIPIDPRCRLVGQKMNPSRTYTPRGAVGIAGPVAAIYPVVSPGGYQLFGRTLPAWQTWGRGADFELNRPWLLRPFDRVRFKSVMEEEYERIEKEFDAGRYEFEIEPLEFSMKEYDAFVESVSDEVAKFRNKQAAGVAIESARENTLLAEWNAEREAKAAEARMNAGANAINPESAADGPSIRSPMSASVWKIRFSPGQSIQSAEDVVVILEAMKTEINVLAGEESVGCVVRGFGSGVAEGQAVQAGDVLVHLE